jgi:hypothetical protein
MKKQAAGRKYGRFIVVCFVTMFVLVLLNVAIFAADNGKQSLTKTHRFLVLCCGAFGGLLFGIRDKKLPLPQLSAAHTFEPGILADILFGFAGGIVIFLIIPGEFDLSPGKIDIFKFFGVALIGGYGGRALVEKILSQQIKDLQEGLDQLKDQSSVDATATALLNKHFDDDPDTPLVAVDKLKKGITETSQSTRVHIFERAREFRRKALIDVIEHRKINRIELVIPVFEALIMSDEKQVYHRNYGQLAFALKDQKIADWAQAMEKLSTAIEIRDRNKVKGFYVYEFNRAVCRIKITDKIDEIKKDLDVALTGPKTKEWVKSPDEKYCKPLKDWLKDNREALKRWIEVNQVKIG